MNSLSSRRVKAFALAGCLTLAPLAVVVAGPPAGAAVAAARTTGSSSAYAQAAAHFSVFARPAAAGDGLPAGSAYAGGISRRIAGSTQPFSAWGVVRGNQLCVTVNARSGPAAGGPAACNSVRQLTRPGQFLVLAAGTGTGTAAQILAGLLPDGVSSVTVSYTNGSTAAVPVTSNGFAIQTGRLVPRSLRLESGLVNLGAVRMSPAPDYTGEFCYGVLLGEGNTCSSRTVSNIRRAIGHGSDYTFVDVAGGGLSKWGKCSSDGCTADTGYLSRDVTGNGLIENDGPCNCTGYYYGWLYS